MRLKILLSVILFNGLMIPSLWAKDENGFAYIELPQMFNLNSRSTSRSLILDAETGAINDTTNKISFPFLDPIFLSNITVGYSFANGRAFEFEWVSYDFYASQIDGRDVINGDYLASAARLEYNMFNFREDFWNKGDYSAFYKVGIGLGQPNFPNKANEDGNEIEFAYQLVVGGTYTINKYVDLEAYYKYFSNVPRMRQVASVGYEQKIHFIESSLNLAVKFKFDVLNAME